MNLLILNQDAQAALSDLNGSARQDQRLTPAKLANGDGGLNLDVMADCGPGQTWEHYGEFLRTLPVENRSDFAMEVGL